MDETTHGDLRAAPDWKVIGVFDPDRETPESSYTVGLAGRGLPELHLWARPSDGLDPGEDWSFNAKERAGLLNMLARRLIAATLEPGATWAEEMDFGLTTVTFAVGDPVGRAAFEVGLTDRGARVLPVTFSLHRDVLHAVGDLDDVARTEIASWTRDITAATVPMPGVPATGPVSAAEFGPAEELVRAVRAAVAAAAPHDVAQVAVLSMLLTEAGGMQPALVLGATAAFARATGLDGAFVAARTAGLEDANALLSDPDVLAALLELMGEWPSSPAAEEARSVLGSLLSHALAAAYTCAVVVDVLRPDVLTAGLGPVLTGALDSRLERLWFPTEVREAVREQMADIPADVLTDLLHALPDLVAPAGRLRGAALVAGGDCPPVRALLAGTATLDTVEHVWGRDPESAEEILRLLTDVARSLAYPDSADAGRVYALLG